MDADAVELARAALARGLTVTTAAARAGVSRETLYQWMRQSDALRQARAMGMGQLEEVVLTEALKDGELAMKVLAVRRPKAWGRKDNMRVTGEVKHSLAPSGPEAVAQLESMLRALKGAE
jgi:transposase-like protein